MRRLISICSLFLFVGGGCLPFQPTMTSTAVPSVPTVASVVMQDVATKDVHGLFVLPKNRAGKIPGVLVIHEWWGLNDQIKDEAKKLAAEGYAVFAIDLYDGEIAADAKRAGELAGSVRGKPEVALAKMKSALDFLAAQPEVQGDNLASLGWCFGGGFSALEGTAGDPRLKATVIYYGTPITDAKQLSRMKRPVLGIWGEDDQSIPVANVEAFEAALKKQGTPVKFHIYPGAGHAFANPTRGDAYRPEATADAWSKTLRFLSEQLKK